MDRLALYDLRERSVHRLSTKTYSALNRGWVGLYPSIRRLYKQDDDGFDWQTWERDFLILMYLALQGEANFLARMEVSLWAERSRILAANPDGIYNDYLLTGDDRLKRIAQSTQTGVQRDIAQWQAEGGEFQDLVDQLRMRFNRDRAERIAAYETESMMSAAVRESAHQLGIHSWQWIHIGPDDPCEILCAPRIGLRFGMNEPMPPAHLWCHCFADLEV